ncbi:zinc finger protein [Wuchereria bancrofti]|uniref:Zinc finger protein n=1 Tax=Wuchereria bancrofti TaxID=6293 RepID=J9FED7_WUCBA|nr:zinc finger protein [Wuchereria bancrofti]
MKNLRYKWHQWRSVTEKRELVLRTRTIQILVSATHEVLAAATPKEFHPADLGDLPEQLRRELQVPQAEPHTVVQEQGNNNIGNSVWYLQQAVRNIKRVAYSRLENAQAGRIVKGCRWFLRLLSPGFTAAQKTAAVEHHALDWYPRAYAAIINEGQVKRPRFDLMGEKRMFITSSFQANDNIGHSSRGQIVATCSNFLCSINGGLPRGLLDSKN